MSTTKVAITLDEKILEEIDRLVREKKYPNRSKAIQDAIQYRIDRLSKFRLTEEVQKLNPEEEKAMAEEGIAVENEQWPEY